MSISRPLVSVIVPVRDGALTLPSVLGALLDSDLPRLSWELIVVDDVSGDNSAEIAARFADTVLRLSGSARGPAYARNRGFELSRGEIVVFVDADVCVQADTLRRFVGRLAADPTVAAIIGAYDGEPPGHSLVTHYRNLRHLHLRLQSAGEIDFFWPACGAIRRAAFVSAGMFDEWHYWRPQVEGAELGHRVRQANQRILLDPHIQAKHLKQFTAASVIATDLRDLGVPWMRLLFQERTVATARAPSLSTREKLRTALLWAALIAGVVSSVAAVPGLTELALGAFIGTLAVSAPLFAFMRRARGAAFVVAVLPLQMLHYVVTGSSVALAWLLHMIVGEPQRNATDDAFAEVGCRTWPPIPRRRLSDAWRSNSG